MSFIASTSAERSSAFLADTASSVPAGNDALRQPTGFAYAATMRSAAIVSASLGEGAERADVRHVPSEVLVNAGREICSHQPSEAGAKPAGAQAETVPQHEIRRSEILVRAGREIALSADNNTSQRLAVKYWPKARVVPAALLKVAYPMGPVYSRETIKAGTMWVPLAKATPPKSTPPNGSSSHQASADASAPAPAARPLYGRRSADAGLEHLSNHARLQPSSREPETRPAGDGK